MAAGLGFIEFTTGDVLSASAANGYLASQTVMVFATAAARTAAITSPQEGMFSFLKDSDTTQFYTGAAWANVDTGASPLTTKGDIYGFSTTNARLPVGTNAQVLTADSAEATGLKWATAAPGGMTLLSTTALTGSVLTVSSISQSYKHLFVLAKDIYMSINDAGADVRFNGDSGSKYTMSNLRINNTTMTVESGIVTELSNAIFSNPSTNTNTKLSSVAINIYRYTEISTIVGDFQSISTKDDSTAQSSRAPFSYAASAGITSISFLTNAGTFSGGNVYIYGVN